MRILYPFHKKFIDSARFMASSVWNLVNNLSKRIHKIKCKDCDCFPRYESVKGNSIKHEAHLATRTAAVDPWHLKVEVAD